MPLKEYCIYTDEVGYGSWAGPVVVCSILYEKIDNYEVRDSKSLTKNMRNNTFHKIRNKYDFALSWSHAHDIDKFGLRVATDDAIRKSWNMLKNKYNKLNKNSQLSSKNVNKMNILLDGKYIPKTIHNVISLVNGDKNNLMISYASIIAKESRDFYMKQLGQFYCKYSWESNVGYGTKNHIDAINEFGITKFHRKSYKPLRKFSDSR
ncbi:ribonuclease HII [Candidatus Cytomitobacter indipagum]|uniref:Ribonuclease n=1 Tax=Candidatus Cytomitobacter indipagum TaxID=2601575 RepID=A0A5C0UE65_9PROT|nr:ribonuclease HII [Candidatus Cytomitobacter indipagum]QEK37997.1 ribonuclease HII [Candidatus Cytomitobacter indipagum]